MKRLVLVSAAAVTGGLAAVWLFRSKRSRVVDAALSRVGDSNAERYWADVMATNDRPRDWCGAFALWALHRAGLAKNWYWQTGLGFLFRLPTTRDPKPGDVAYFDRNQHHAVVTAVTGNDVALVNGNGAEGRVSTSRVAKSAVTSFYSIAPLLA
jgi:hypothetical protein